MEPLNLQNLLTRFSDHWSQRTIGTLNDYEIKLAKLLGEFVWHSHPDTDELFLIVYGTLNIQLRDRDVILKPGEVFVVPRGVEHVSHFTSPRSPAKWRLLTGEFVVSESGTGGWGHVVGTERRREHWGFG